MRHILLPLALLLASPVLRAQNFNLDVGDNLVLWPVPSSAYGAAAAQPGFWNDVHHPYSTALADLAGNPTGASSTSTITSSFNWPFGPLTGDDMNLMNDIQAISSTSGTAVWTFNGLANGNYAVYTYAWAPDSANARTSVDVPGALEGQQIVGGAWGGSPHVQGITYALHHISVSSGTIVVNCAGALGTSGSVNGFQLVFEGSLFGSFCAGDPAGAGVPCPCNNYGLAGHGCENSASTGGALLTASGTINPDTVQMQSSNELPSVSSILLQGNGVQPFSVPFGDGARCVAGTLKRLYVVSAVGGVATFPPPGALGIRARSALLGDTIATGTLRHYQVYYRDPDTTFCVPSPANYNVSNAVTVNW